MNKIKLSFGAINAIVFLTYQEPLNAQCNIIPNPQQVTFGHGHFTINDKTQIVCANPAMKAEAGKLQKFILDETGITVSVTNRKK